MLVLVDLGLAYPPRTAVDASDHAARIALLAEDCADLPIEHLREAAAHWRKTKPWLPRACELREETLARARLAMRGRMLPAQSRTAPAKSSQPPLTQAEIDALPPHLRSIGEELGEISPSSEGHKG